MKARLSVSADCQVVCNDSDCNDVDTVTSTGNTTERKISDLLSIMMTNKKSPNSIVIDVTI